MQLSEKRTPQVNLGESLEDEGFPSETHLTEVLMNRRPPKESELRV